MYKIGNILKGFNSTLEIRIEEIKKDLYVSIDYGHGYICSIIKEGPLYTGSGRLAAQNIDSAGYAGINWGETDFKKYFHPPSPARKLKFSDILK